MTLVAAVLMSLSNCERNEESVVPADPTKLSGEWKLVEPASAYEVTLKLEVDPAAQTIAGVTPFKVSGRSSVNQYFAQASFGSSAQEGTNPGNGVSVGVIGATKMAGPPEAMQFETEYFNNLKAVSRYELTSRNRLRLLYNGSKSGVLIYEKTK